MTTTPQLDHGVWGLPKPHDPKAPRQPAPWPATPLPAPVIARSPREPRR
jgi:hypothetical protein